MAIYGVKNFPSVAFYILPTRAWELLVGAILCYIVFLNKNRKFFYKYRHPGSLIGLLFIIFSVLIFDQSYLSPGPWILIPVLGAAFIIAFATEGTIVNRILSGNLMMGLGLISYSLYLWHQPVFALARVYSANHVSPCTYTALIFLTIALSYFSWKYVEQPFRNRTFIKPAPIFIFTIFGSLIFVAGGFYLNKTYGMAWRTFGPNVEIADMDKRAYNERTFKYKVDSFKNNGGLKIYVLGNSFGRDFINMTTETFAPEKLDITYDDNVTYCIPEYTSKPKNNLFTDANIIIYASGYMDNYSIDNDCINKNIDWAKSNKKEILFIGTKGFGDNLNWIARINPDQRADLYNGLSTSDAIDAKKEMNAVPFENYISLLDPVVKNGQIPITDHNGIMISTDRRHVTKYGALYFGKYALQPSQYGAIINAYTPKGQ